MYIEDSSSSELNKSAKPSSSLKDVLAKRAMVGSVGQPSPMQEMGPVSAMGGSVGSMGPKPGSIMPGGSGGLGGAVGGPEGSLWGSPGGHSGGTSGMGGYLQKLMKLGSTGY